MAQFVAPKPEAGELFEHYFTRLTAAVEAHVREITGITDAMRPEPREWR